MNKFLSLEDLLRNQGQGSGLARNVLAMWTNYNVDPIKETERLNAQIMPHAQVNAEAVRDYLHQLFMVTYQDLDLNSEWVLVDLTELSELWSLPQDLAQVFSGIQAVQTGTALKHQHAAPVASDVMERFNLGPVPALMGVTMPDGEHAVVNLDQVAAFVPYKAEHASVLYMAPTDDAHTSIVLASGVTLPIRESIDELMGLISSAYSESIEPATDLPPDVLEEMRHELEAEAAQERARDNSMFPPGWSPGEVLHMQRVTRIDAITADDLTWYRMRMSNAGLTPLDTLIEPNRGMSARRLPYSLFVKFKRIDESAFNLILSEHINGAEHGMSYDGTLVVQPHHGG